MTLSDEVNNEYGKRWQQSVHTESLNPELDFLECECGLEQNIINSVCVSCGKDLR